MHQAVKTFLRVGGMMNWLLQNSLMQQLMMRILMWQSIQLGMKPWGGGGLMNNRTMQLMMPTMKPLRFQ